MKMKINLTKPVGLSKPEGRHRRADGSPKAYGQVIVGINGQLWRWDEGWHTWVADEPAQPSITRGLTRALAPVG